MGGEAMSNVLLLRREGMMQVGDEWDKYAIQTLDSTKPNYNPAVAIILQTHGLGNTKATPLIQGGGRWYLTKAQAATITVLSNNMGGNIRKSWFIKTTDVIDNNAIVTSDNTLSYPLTEFNEFEYFTSYQFENYYGLANNAFMELCTNLESITLPLQCKIITDRSFRGCTNLKTITNFEIVEETEYDVFKDCKNLEISDISNLVVIGAGLFKNCKKITATEINSNVTSITENINRLDTFRNTKAIPYLHFLSETPITGLLNFARNHGYNAFSGTTYKLYVGDGTSAAHDDAVLDAYLQVSPWSLMSTDMDTWYNFINS